MSKFDKARKSVGSNRLGGGGGGGVVCESGPNSIKRIWLLGWACISTEIRVSIGFHVSSQ